ncbi:tRNA (guanosine(37)-N1)-methyltransferase TrmD [Candidatus Falkowbacteria bacterium]|nr:tRNA (guanosine(37)-N1)-methyltransferase TrmD [Candidatus Falkowbacteria bacterium]
MKFKIITIFPEIFSSYISESIIKRAQEKGIVSIKPYNLRDWTEDNHKTVDDTPYGGGAGMVMKIEPIYKALQAIDPQGKGVKNKKIVLMSAKGKTWDQQMAKKYAKLDEVIFICGRYEGVDERVAKLIDEEVSIGDYVMTGGELGALVMIDSITRLLPGALGNAESAVQESHTTPGILEYPQYTRPEEFEINGKKYKVPDVLLSGNHAEIEKWRKAESRNKK